ncbi:MAG: DEAD/DEAH box helicase, partial [Vallitaleaceae bacterium]|nr:DEAD/DEAH box helicase [Vallitaleaceae bacterium]
MKKTFEQYPLDARIHEALKRLDYKEATEVQEKLIPLALEGRDAIVSSKTGSGKTASYLIPILNQIKETEKNPQVLIIVPTRELAVQVKEEIQWIGRYKKIQGIQIFGQQPMDAQILALKQRVHAIVATPGRLLDHIQRGNVQLHQIQYLVIDEADKLLEMGFIEQVESIILELPKERTTFMLSATIEPELERLCEQYMRNPLRLEFHEEIPRELKQHYYLIEEKEREASFLRLLYCLNPSRAIVFCNTQEKVDELHITMKTEGFRSVCLHGGLSQKERLRNIKEFKLGTVPYLIATDLAARGIHVDDVECVINYELPFQKENYVHRIGRSGRIDQEGLGISLVS